VCEGLIVRAYKPWIYIFVPIMAVRQLGVPEIVNHGSGHRAERIGRVNPKLKPSE
jgi:hypothetical protein